MRRRSFLRGIAAAAASTAVPVPAVAKMLAPPHVRTATEMLALQRAFERNCARAVEDSLLDAFNYGMSMLRFDGEYEHIEWCDVVSPPPMVRK